MARLTAQRAGVLERFNGWAARRQSTADREQQDFMKEAWQSWLRIAVQLTRGKTQSQPWAVGVTSSVRGEGRTTSAIGLAAALARETIDPVVLVDADIHNPCAGQLFGFDGEPALEDYLENRISLDDTVIPTRLQNLSLIAARGGGGSRHTVDSPYLFRRRLPSMLAQLREDFSFIVLDMPPVMQDANTAGIAAELDGVVLVTRFGRTEVQDLEEAAERLGGAHIVATVNILPSDDVPVWAQRFLKE